VEKGGGEGRRFHGETEERVAKVFEEV